MTRRTWFLLAALAGVVLLCGAYVAYYGYYWRPVRDLRALGFAFIRAWTPNTFHGDYGIDGWSEEYRFEISSERERALRSQCRDDPAHDNEKTIGACLLTVRREGTAPVIEVGLQREALTITYSVGPPIRNVD